MNKFIYLEAPIDKNIFIKNSIYKYKIWYNWYDYNSLHDKICKRQKRDMYILVSLKRGLFMINFGLKVVSKGKVYMWDLYDLP